MTDQKQTPADGEIKNGFFINNGTFSGNFTTPDGDQYDIRKLEPREVTDPRSGEVSTIWGGYATARDRDIAAKDAMMQAEFKKTGARPADLFARASPRHPALRHLAQPPRQGLHRHRLVLERTRPLHGFARDLVGKSGLRFGGNVLAWKSTAALEADRAAKADVAAPAAAAPQPDAEAARAGADKRARKGRDAKPSADA